MVRQPYMTLARLADLPVEDLKAEWARRYGAPAPSLSTELLRLGVGYKLQEQKQGGVDRSTRRFLRQLATRPAQGRDGRPRPRKLTAGTKLIRDWHGAGYTVTVLEQGFEYDGRRWTSLTAIAKAITGVQWNGPRFFGLSERRK